MKEETKRMDFLREMLTEQVISDEEPKFLSSAALAKGISYATQIETSSKEVGEFMTELGLKDKASRSSDGKQRGYKLLKSDLETPEEPEPTAEDDSEPEDIQSGEESFNDFIEEVSTQYNELEDDVRSKVAFDQYLNNYLMWSGGGS